MEKRLKELDPGLHKRFTDTVFVMQHSLSKFKRLFPEYTDHSVFHTLDVIDFCNRLIGAEQMQKLNADELYVLLMGCYLHDSGMAIAEPDYEEFKDQLGVEAYFRRKPDAAVCDFVRDKHNEFSGLFIEKYADFLEIPTPEMVFAIKQVARGHRRTNLFYESEYPEALDMKDGLTVCTPYLACLIRLADELDVIADRNPKLLYDIETLTDEVEIVHNTILMSVPKLDILDEGFIVYTNTKDEEIYAAIEKAVDKMQDTLDLCRTVTEMRSDFRISQQWVQLNRI